MPMALGKHLFSFRTQKLSPVAAIILRKWETSTVPNYIKAFRTGRLLSFVYAIMIGILLLTDQGDYSNERKRSKNS